MAVQLAGVDRETGSGGVWDLREYLAGRVAERRRTEQCNE
jgi:hypothetical protein